MPKKDNKLQIDYVFQDEALLREALTHPGYDSFFNYERLEFLGDAILGFVMGAVLFQKFPHANAGELSKRHISLVKQETLALIANNINIENSIILSEGDRKNNVQCNNSTLENVLEALIAAVYLDRGFDAVYNFTYSLWLPIIESMQDIPLDPKSVVQEWMQKKYGSLPKYELTSKSGPDHNPVFFVELDLEGYPKVQASGATKKNAEKNAAYKAIERWGVTLN